MSHIDNGHSMGKKPRNISFIFFLYKYSQYVVPNSLYGYLPFTFRRTTGPTRRSTKGNWTPEEVAKQTLVLHVQNLFLGLFIEWLIACMFAI